MIRRVLPNQKSKRTGLTSDRLGVAPCGGRLSDNYSILGDKMLTPNLCITLKVSRVASLFLCKRCIHARRAFKLL